MNFVGHKQITRDIERFLHCHEQYLETLVDKISVNLGF